MVSERLAWLAVTPRSYRASQSLLIKTHEESQEWARAQKTTQVHQEDTEVEGGSLHLCDEGWFFMDT